jgi:hypothetical protein
LASGRSMMKIEGSGSESGSISQRHGFADPDPHTRMSWIRNTTVVSPWPTSRAGSSHKTQNQCRGSGICCLLDPGSGMGKKSAFGSGMNKPNHIYES